MSLNFPPSANTGDIYTSGNASYEFTGTKWKPVNRVDYTVQASDIAAANNELVIDFDTDGIQRLTLSEEADVIFANLPAEGEYKKVLLDLTANTDPDYIETIPWEVSSASYEAGKFKSVFTEDPTLRCVLFKPDGTKMYIVGGNSDTVYQYSLSIPWDVSSASYETGKFKSVTTEEGSPYGLFFKPDGTKMYIVGESSDTVYQYALSTPWDVSSASYETGKFKSVAAEDANPLKLFFKPDGTKMYIVGYATDTVYQYALSTPWDVSSASYEAGKFKSVTAEETEPFGIYLKPDGTKMYIVGVTSDTVYQYSLSIPWDVSSASYEAGKFKSVTTEDTIPLGLFFKPDGTKMYIVGGSSDTVYQYNTTASITLSSLQWPETIEWEDGTTPTLPALTETALIELEARTDYLGTNYIGRLVGRNF